MFSQPLVVHYGGGVNSTAMLIGMCQSGVVPGPRITGNHDGQAAKEQGLLDRSRLQNSGGELPPKPDTPVPGLRAKELLPQVEGPAPGAIHSEMGSGSEGLGTWSPGDQMHRIRLLASGLQANIQFPEARWRAIPDGVSSDRMRLGPEGVRSPNRDGRPPAPVKSACFFCPASKPWEVLWLAWKHPDLLVRAIKLEDRAQPHLQTVEGLWRSSTKARPGSWRRWVEQMGLISKDQSRAELIGTPERIRHLSSRAPSGRFNRGFSSRPVPVTRREGRSLYRGNELNVASLLIGQASAWLDWARVVLLGGHD